MSDEAAFTPLEEAFFRAGETEEQQPSEPERDEVVNLRPFLVRLFSRKQPQQ